MFEPKVDKDTANLHALTRGRFKNWKRQVEAEFPQFSIGITETRRSRARQNYLYGIGRTHHRNQKPVTWTLESRHLYGLAIDWHVVRRLTGRADWNPDVFRTILERVPPERYQLKSLASIGDLAHLEVMEADHLISIGRPLGVKAA
jgi:hypothetical protein